MYEVAQLVQTAAVSYSVQLGVGRSQLLLTVRTYSPEHVVQLPAEMLL